MKNRKLTAVVVLLFLVIMQGCNSSGNKTGDKDAVLLQFNLQKGKSYTYSMNMDMDAEVQGQKMDNSMGFDYSLYVVDDKDSVKTLRTTFDRVKMEMSAGQVNIDVDTDEPQKDSVVDIRANPMGIMSNMFYAMKGKSFEMKINNRGEVLSVTGLDELQQAMINSFGDDENVKQAMGQAFQSQFNEENIKKSFAQSFSIYPDKPVKVGDTWTKKMSMGGPMAADMNTTYKVKEINNGNVVLDLTSDLDMNGTKGTSTGTMKVQPETGMVLDATLEQKVTAPMPMTITTKITGKEK